MWKFHLMSPQLIHQTLADASIIAEITKIIHFHLALFILEKFIVDECDTYREVANWQRSAGYILDPKSQASFCDIKLLTGWYRFTSRAGGTIPDKCPPVFACGEFLY